MKQVTQKDLLAFRDSVNNCKALKSVQKKFLSGLSEEQQRIIIGEAKYCLIRSAAGSGKTTVLVAKYLYLTRILGVPTERIVYLSFNNRNVDDTAKKLKELSVSEEEISKFAFTFHALALKIINSVEQVWPVLLEMVQISWGKAEMDHDKAEVYLSKYRDEIKKDIERDSHFRKAIIQATVRSKKGKPHRYVSYYLDRNGLPGSCRSEQEKDIFEKLAKHGVDFAYEEADKERHRRPDFTIYTRTGQRVIYEHFTAKDQQELETISKKEGTRYLKAEREKLEQYPNVYGENNCIFTYGAGKTVDEIWTQLKNDFDTKDIAYDESNERKPQLTTDKILEIVVDKFKEVRNLIVETGRDVMPTAELLSKERGYVGYFFQKIFIPLEQKYSHFITDNSGYTDFADSIVKAAKYCRKHKNMLNNFYYEFVLVDEFQDISVSRHKLLKSLKAVNPKLHLMAVGDDWQSIYSFSCSDLSLFYHFKDNWGISSVEMDMSETFRFGGSVLDVSTSFIEKDNLLSSHKVVSATDRKTSLIIKSFRAANSFKERRTMQWDFIKKAMTSELSSNPKTEFLVLSRYSNIARGFQKDLQNSALISKIGKDKEISLTIHRAKGLTADVVFIQECQKKAIPLVKQKQDLSEHDRLLSFVRCEYMDKERNEKKYQEERRLFYVALTRAKKKVFILYDENLKSEFVDEICGYRDRKRPI